MTTTAVTRHSLNDPAWVAEARRRHPAWYYTALAFAALGALCWLAMLVDPRTLNDVSVWNKPMKFFVSLAIYLATLAWFAPLLPDGYFRRLEGRAITLLAIVVSVFELGYIVAQAAQGEHSHFNFTTEWHIRMYSLMGVGATLLVGIALWLGVRILWHRGLREPYTLAVGLGLILTFLLGGTFGGYMSSQGGHWVGGSPTDANGLVVVNWSRDGGDLRVAHFFGMHAMQALPIFASLLPASLAASRRIGLVVAAALAWAALTAFTFVQALAGRPFV